MQLTQWEQAMITRAVEALESIAESLKDIKEQKENSSSPEDSDDDYDGGNPWIPEDCRPDYPSRF